ncbi:TetR/AcrR family transcriptional regulator [Verrucomicrobiales bacterium BCK34]|nr:TetR/AcrR family transcriptional regulator [Verrucomicrobiales bacterium BCK34]
MSEGNTKERILDAAEEIILEESFHSVGINQILSAVGVPKGSFYHYFASKEEFGAEMIRHHVSRENGRRSRILLNSDIENNPIQRLLTFFETTIGRIHESGGKCPCLMQKLAAEVSNFSDTMREELGKGFAGVIRIFKELLDEAVAKNLLPADLDTEAEATFIMDLWAGAQQRTIITRTTDPTRRAVEIFRKRLT